MGLDEYIRIYGRGDRIFEYNAPQLEIDGDYIFNECEFNNARVIKWRGTFTANSLHLNDIADMYKIEAYLIVGALRITLGGKTITIETSYAHSEYMREKGYDVLVHLGYYSSAPLTSFSGPCPCEDYKNVYNVAQYICSKNCIG